MLNMNSLSLGSSPWTYTAPMEGLILVANAGSMGVPSYIRNGSAIPCAGASAGRSATPGQIVVYGGDSVQFTWTSTPPTLYFVPKPV